MLTQYKTTAVIALLIIAFLVISAIADSWNYGAALPGTQSAFTGQYQAFSDTDLDITASAEVYFWLDGQWSGDDFGGNASSVVGYWEGCTISGDNIRTDAAVAKLKLNIGDATWLTIYVD